MQCSYITLVNPSNLRPYHTTLGPAAVHWVQALPVLRSWHHHWL